MKENFTMNLSEKILELRKQRGMSQEELAEKLNVSRQSVSRWENGSAQPDASNLSQLTKLFNVTADYLINDDYKNDTDIPIVKKIEMEARNKILKIFGACIALLGLVGNFVIYILSRFISVLIPYITHDNAGGKTYTWGKLTGYSYKYFIQQYSLEFLVILFWTLVVVGVFVAFSNMQKLKAFTIKVTDNMRSKKTK